MNKHKIIILGGGTAGWITAAILSKGLNLDKYQITLIESPDIPTVGVGEATIPPIVQLASFLEINEAELLSKISATFKYGIHFENWHKNDASYMHAFGTLGTNFNDLSFPEFWLKSSANTPLNNLNRFSPTAVAAYQNLFNHPQKVPVGSKPNLYFPLTDLHYAYHFDAGLLATFLKDYAIKAGVNFVAATVNKAYQNQKGEITQLQLHDNNSISGDFFVDCSGAKGILSKQVLNSEFTAWGQYFPCDSALAVQTKSSDTPPAPYTKSIAMNAGWRWQIPLQHRNGNGYVYASNYCSDTQAEAEFTQALGTQEKLTDIKKITFETGCLQNPWNKNCIALGLASGFLEPLESTSIHMTHKYALELMNAFRYGENMTDEANRFNIKFVEDSTMIRDFLIMHYKVTQREDTPFWLHCQHMDIPTSLETKLTEFKETGHISLPKNSLFSFQSWFQVLIGQEYLTNYKPFYDPAFDVNNTQFFLSNIETAIKTEVAKLNSHQQYLAKYLQQ